MKWNQDRADLHIRTAAIGTNDLALREKKEKDARRFAYRLMKNYK